LSDVLEVSLLVVVTNLLRYRKEVTGTAESAEKPTRYVRFGAGVAMQ